MSIQSKSDRNEKEPGRQLGIGIVGCGAVSEIHAEVIQALDETQLVSVYSRKIENARKLGSKFGVTTHHVWERFIEDEKLDAVSVCTPSGTHLDYGRDVAKAGKHVIVEKPIEVSVTRGRELIEACEDNDVHLAVIYQNRFLPDVREMKRRIEAGELGKPFMADAVVKWFRSQEYYDSAEWRGTLALDGGGVLINQAIHTIDLLLWMMGDVESVYGRTGTFTHARIEGEDAAAAVLRFRSGALGIIEASTSVLPAEERRLTIHGERGTAVLEGNVVRFYDEKNGPCGDEDKKSRKGGGAKAPMEGFSLEPHRRQFMTIIESILEDRPPPLTGEEALRSLAVVQAVYASAERGILVDIAQFIQDNR